METKDYINKMCEYCYNNEKCDNNCINSFKEFDTIIYKCDKYKKKYIVEKHFIYNNHIFYY